MQQRQQIGQQLLINFICITSEWALPVQGQDQKKRIHRHTDTAILVEPQPPWLGQLPTPCSLAMMAMGMMASSPPYMTNPELLDHIAAAAIAKKQ
eukprot:COSAG01_NODE_44706_length_416_cov_1.069401_1_plen_94_part_10